MQRRFFGKMIVGSAAWFTSLSALAQAPTKLRASDAVATKETADAHHLEAIQRHADLVQGEKLKIAMLIYPGMFLQDLVGPLTVFEALMNREIYLVWKDKELVGNEGETPTLIPVRATHTLQECPDQLDVLFVPGGVPGTFTMMEDPEILEFLRAKAATARYVTSVCTGSLILGAAGLLRGYRASSYWATLPVLKDLQAIPVARRIVTDRNRITGGGVTAGIDLALAIVAKLRSPDYAKTVQLYLEYDPQPPFDAGSFAKAPLRARRFLQDMYAGMVATSHAISQKISARW
jgi:cyclohexyl-isocyanide hydratase